jgi:hypothetical protein
VALEAYVKGIKKHSIARVSPTLYYFGLIYVAIFDLILLFAFFRITGSAIGIHALVAL